MKTDLHHYLRQIRQVMLWKLAGLSEHDIRRPLTPTGTNLLGLVKHLTGVELLYFGYVFGRPYPQPVHWLRQDAEPNTDLWATADESRSDIIELYRGACAHSDATIDELPLDAVGQVEWWPGNATTLHRVLIHVIAESNRHAGHADIVRELVDGTVGLAEGNDFMPPGDEAWWADYRATVTKVSEGFVQH
nr:DinB family protein [Kibdelosporangium sp. MJ126-NF4]CEL17775.1 Type I restriction-modification system methyltransferase subunit [Kibdelosporangium sp. MJ126-NF4]CTQ91001.1 Type I restriction-modification system methyltransferase subunit [Kibdelosporangium sp. MJ126-NF4]